MHSQTLSREQSIQHRTDTQEPSPQPPLPGGPAPATQTVSLHSPHVYVYGVLLWSGHVHAQGQAKANLAALLLCLF